MISLLRFIVLQSLKLLLVEFRAISDFRKINVALNPLWSITKLCKTLYVQECRNSIIKHWFYRVVYKQKELDAKIEVVIKSCIVAMETYNTVKMTNLLNDLLNNISWFET